MASIMTSWTQVLRLAAAAFLLAAGGAAPAAAPVVTDELLAPLQAAYLRAVAPGESADLHSELFGNVLRRVQRSHATDVDVPLLIATAQKTLDPLPAGEGDPEAVFTKSINAALAALDPYSRYLDPQAAARFRDSIRGSFAGLGLRVEMVEGQLRIAVTMPNTPAARAGLQKGDVILRLDDEVAEGMTLSDAITRMRGDPGTPIAMTIRRTGRDDPFTVSLVREVIRTEPVRWSLEGGVLVLRLVTFTSSVYAEMEKAIAEASARGQPRAIVLDMRGNGGGLFRQAVLTADAFLSAGDIVSLRGRTAANQRTWSADPAEQLAGVPMVVLIDGRTASAAELVAAALQESGRAIVMGQRSFGKGSVQAMIPLGDDKGALRLTTALYYGPSGRSVQRTGVGPDIELVPAAARAGASAARRREADRDHALAGADEPPPPRAKVDESRCAAPAGKKLEPALACALAFIDAGGIDTFAAAVEPAKPPQ